MEGQQQPMEAVYRSRIKKRCSEHALVLETVGVEFDIRHEDGEYTILVAESDAARAREELHACIQENRGGSRRVLVFPHQAGVWTGVYGFVAVLLLVDVFEDHTLFGINWAHAGRTHADLIQQGQWWRTVTALTLHADWAHLIGNIVVGGLFGLFAAQLLGSGLAWLSILIGGAAGNGINAWIQPAQHTSVGASTAVFSALGMVAAYVWTRRRHMPASAFVRWAPLVSGIVLLGYFGAGGGRTDVVAHLAGFCCGLLLGALYSTLGDRVLFSARVHSVLGTAALALLVLAWTRAIGAMSIR